MSWLSDHLFGVPKPKDGTTTDETAAAATATEPPQPPSADSPASDEVQNATVTTSNTMTSEEAAAAAAAYENRDVAAEWQVPVRGKLHKVEFEHGTTSGKRILWIDEKVLCRSFSKLIFISNFY